MKKIVKDELIVGKSPRSISEIDIDDQKFLKNPAVIDLGYAVSEKIITCKSFQWFDSNGSNGSKVSNGSCSGTYIYQNSLTSVRSVATRVRAP